LQTAFDCINHDILLVKLEIYGIRDTVYSLNHILKTDIKE